MLSSRTHRAIITLPNLPRRYLQRCRAFRAFSTLSVTLLGVLRRANRRLSVTLSALARAVTLTAALSAARLLLRDICRANWRAMCYTSSAARVLPSSSRALCCDLSLSCSQPLDSAEFFPSSAPLCQSRSVALSRSSFALEFCDSRYLPLSRSLSGLAFVRRATHST